MVFLEEYIKLRTEQSVELTHLELDHNLQFVANPWNNERAYLEGMLVYHSDTTTASTDGIGNLTWYRANKDVGPEAFFDPADWDPIGANAATGQVIVKDSNGIFSSVGVVEMSDDFTVSFLGNTATIDISPGAFSIWQEVGDINSTISYNNPVLIGTGGVIDPSYTLSVAGHTLITGDLVVGGTINGIDLVAFYNDYDVHTHTIGSTSLINYTSLYPNSNGQLADIQITALQDGDFLQWSDGTKRWVNTTIAVGAHNLGNHTDVDNAVSIAPLTEQVLVFNNGTGLWENRTLTQNSSTGFLGTPFAHNHDGRYYTKTELLASSGSLINFNNLFNVPVTPSASEPYIVASLTGGLSAERVLTQGTGITITDNGGNNTIVVAQDPNSVVQLTNFQLDGALIGTRPTLNFITPVSGDVSVSVVDNGGSQRIDVEIDFTGTFPTAPVTSVNGAIGVVVLNVADINDTSITPGLFPGPGSGSPYTPGTNILAYDDDISKWVNVPASSLLAGISGIYLDDILDVDIAVTALVDKNILYYDAVSGLWVDGHANDANIYSITDLLLGALDVRYYTETELSVSGGGSIVHWDNLISVPGFAPAAHTHYVHELQDVLDYSGGLPNNGEVLIWNNITELWEAGPQAGNVPTLVDGITIDYNTAGELEVIGVDATPVDGITIDYNTNGELTVLSAGGGESLEETLAIGDITGANDIRISDSQAIRAVNGNGVLKLRDANDDAVLLASNENLIGGWYYADQSKVTMGLNDGSKSISFSSPGISIYQDGESVTSSWSEIIIQDIALTGSVSQTQNHRSAIYLNSSACSFTTDVVDSVIMASRLCDFGFSSFGIPQHSAIIASRGDALNTVIEGDVYGSVIIGSISVALEGDISHSGIYNSKNSAIDGSGHIVQGSSIVAANSGFIDSGVAYSAIIGGVTHQIDTNLTGVVILGGAGVTADTSNRIYIGGELYIKTVNTDVTATQSLYLDANGVVVTRPGEAVLVDGITIDYNSAGELEVIGVDATPVDGITIDYNSSGELEVVGIVSPPVDGITIDYNTNGELEVIGGVVDLQGAYDNSSAGTKILTDAVNGSLSVQEGTGLANTINIYQGLNEAGSTTFYVDGNGRVGATSIQLDLTAAITVTEGQIAWNADAGTIDVGMIGGNVTLQVGQETLMHVKADEAINNGDVVYASGAVGASSQISVSKYLADGSTKAFLILGIATESIASGQFGYITKFGTVRDLDTTGASLTTPETWNIGDILYPSPFNAGELTNIIPITPNIAMPIAFVVNVHATTGALVTRLTPPNELEELHDVHITSPTEGQILQWDGTQGHWHNQDFVPTVDGITIGVNTAGELEVIGVDATPVDGITIDYNTSGELEVIKPSTRNWTWSAGSGSPNTTNSYLRGSGNTYGNVSTYVAAFDCNITAMSAMTSSAATWVAEVRVNGVAQATINIVASATAFSNGLTVPVLAGDTIEFYCNGTLIDYPVINAWFEE